MKRYPKDLFDLSDRYGSFDTHINMLRYCILCHMTYVKWHKCHKLCQYGYQKNRIDQTNWSMPFKLILQEENLKINGKKWYTKISFVFLVQSPCKMCYSGASSRWCPNWPKKFVVSIEVSHNGNPFVAYQFLKKREKWLPLIIRFTLSSSFTYFTSSCSILPT